MTDRKTASSVTHSGSFDESTRAASAVVGKTLEAGIVVLYIGLLTTTLYAGAIPEYRTAAGEEVADRTLADASAEIGTAVPANATAVNATARVDLPDTIRGEEYAIRVDGDRLVLDHPHDAVGGRTPLTLPRTVDAIEGRWESREAAVVRVRSVGDGLEVRLERGRS